MRERANPGSQRTKRVGRRAWVVALALAAALGGAAAARAENAVVAGTGMAFDLIIVRPLTLGQLVFGAVCFVPSALFALDSVGEPWEIFVEDPFQATFTRPLGEFEDDY
jgi:Mn2+/Fe2+ NRAMP family transporter